MRNYPRWKNDSPPPSGDGPELDEATRDKKRILVLDTTLAKNPHDLSEEWFVLYFDSIAREQEPTKQIEAPWGLTAFAEGGEVSERASSPEQTKERIKKMSPETFQAWKEQDEPDPDRAWRKQKVIEAGRGENDPAELSEVFFVQYWMLVMMNEPGQVLVADMSWLLTFCGVGTEELSLWRTEYVLSLVWGAM